MMPMGRRVTPGHTDGLPWLRVQVQEVMNDLALVTDQFGKERQIPVSANRGRLPRAGETWIIDRSLGNWTFASLIAGEPPRVTGSTDDIPALKSLLVAMEQLGLIIDDSVHTRIRSTRPHTHVAPADGGTTTQDSL